MFEAVANDNRYVRWAEDADLLAHLGRALSFQETRVKVRLPGDLGRARSGALERESEEGDLPTETAGQKLTRHRAGTVGLIGLSIHALHAAEDAGLLVDAIPPKRLNATDA